MLYICPECREVFDGPDEHLTELLTAYDDHLAEHALQHEIEDLP